MQIEIFAASIDANRSVQIIADGGEKQLPVFVNIGPRTGGRSDSETVTGVSSVLKPFYLLIAMSNKIPGDGHRLIVLFVLATTVFPFYVIRLRVNDCLGLNDEVRCKHHH